MPTFTGSEIYLIAGIVSAVILAIAIGLIVVMQRQYKQYQRAVWALLPPEGQKFYKVSEVKWCWNQGYTAVRTARLITYSAMHLNRRADDLMTKESDLPLFLRRQSD